MENISLFTNDVNYVELYICKKTAIGFDTNISDEKFSNILSNVKKKKMKCFKKRHIRTFNSGFEHTSENDCDTVQEVRIQDCKSFSKNKLDFTCVLYNKKQQATYTFPSNNEIFDIVQSERLTFKLNNLLYLNFQVTENFEGKVKKEIYFNINYDRNCDESLIKSIVNDTIKFL